MTTRKQHSEIITPSPMKAYFEEVSKKKLVKKNRPRPTAIEKKKKRKSTVKLSNKAKKTCRRGLTLESSSSSNKEDIDENNFCDDNEDDDIDPAQFGDDTTPILPTIRCVVCPKRPMAAIEGDALRSILKNRVKEKPSLLRASKKYVYKYKRMVATLAERLARSPPTKEPGSIPGRVTVFSLAGIVPDDAVGRRVFSGISRFPRPFIPAPLHTHFNHPHRFSRPRRENRSGAGTQEQGKRKVREKIPPASCTVRHDSHLRKSGVDRPGMNPVRHDNAGIIVGQETKAPSPFYFRAAVAFPYLGTAGGVENRLSAFESVRGPWEFSGIWHGVVDGAMRQSPLGMVQGSMKGACSTYAWHGGECRREELATFVSPSPLCSVAHVTHPGPLSRCCNRAAVDVTSLQYGSFSARASLCCTMVAALVFPVLFPLILWCLFQHFAGIWKVSQGCCFPLCVSVWDLEGRKISNAKDMGISKTSVSRKWSAPAVLRRGTHFLNVRPRPPLPNVSIVSEIRGYKLTIRSVLWTVQSTKDKPSTTSCLALLQLGQINLWRGAVPTMELHRVVKEQHLDMVLMQEPHLLRGRILSLQGWFALFGENPMAGI
ncbi:hypothetical protein PR048_019181 [Dryococelus australis]|uniref:Uncharacterized protein n=1 Tax=Dryococelus australis TaxID=614101 RepID=A0ABQ9H2V0_9NEOP|nr:hypothetical protein PR048_019181 [Dryococelus australis]